MEVRAEVKSWNKNPSFSWVGVIKLSGYFRDGCCRLLQNDSMNGQLIIACLRPPQHEARHHHGASFALTFVSKGKECIGITIPCSQTPNKGPQGS